MRVIDDLAQVRSSKDTILTIGNLAGVHRGHGALVRAVIVRAGATGRLAAVMTFDPHPATVLAPDHAPHIRFVEATLDEQLAESAR